MSLAADCSNFTGKFKPGTIDQLIAWKISSLMVGTQVPAVAVDQLMSTRGIFDRMIYIQFDANKDEYDQAKQAFDIVDDAAPTLGRVWVACEQIAIPWTGNATEYQRHFDRMLNNVRGFFPRALIGIYTSFSQWMNLMGNTTLYSQYPLWYANYDDVQVLSAPLWRKQGFGGWYQPEWKQYQQNYSVNGQVFDFSVSPD